MHIYTKYFTFKGAYFEKEYEKTKKNKIQKRPLLEETVAKKFIEEDDVKIIIVNIETGFKTEITKESKREDIEKYLGKKFLEF